MAKKVLWLGQIGCPINPQVKNVRSFLARFLGNPRVVGIKRMIWLPLLYLVILPFYAKKSARLYQRVWDGKSFLSQKISMRIFEKIQPYLTSSEVDVKIFFSCMQQKILFHADDTVLILFPQYAESTHGAIGIEFCKSMLPPYFIPPFFSEIFYIESCVRQINEAVETVQLESKVEALILSFHSVPLKQIAKWSDPYLEQCQKTFDLLSQRLSFENILLAYQSRFGRGQWAGPDILDVAYNLKNQGVKKVAVFCPGFIIDGIETVDEIGRRLKSEMHSHGMEILFIPCLNDREDFIKGLAEYAEGYLSRK